MNQELIVSPGYDELIEAALMGVANKHTYRAYSRWLREFLQYHEEQDKPPITRSEIQGFLSSLISEGKSPQSANQALSAIKHLIDVLVDYQFIDETSAVRIEKLKGIKVLGRKLGSWLSHEQAKDLVNSPGDSLRDLRDKGVLALAIGCGLRRVEIASLKVENLHQVKGRWVLEIKGKHNRTRIVGVSNSVKAHIDRWIGAAGIESGFIFRQLDRNTEEMYDAPIHPGTVYKITARHGERLGLDAKPHDLRRTFATLSLENGAELAQVQRNLGHASIATTERYLNLGFDYENTPSDFIEL